MEPGYILRGIGFDKLREIRIDLCHDHLVEGTLLARRPILAHAI